MTSFSLILLGSAALACSWKKMVFLSPESRLVRVLQSYPQSFLYDSEREEAWDWIGSGWRNDKITVEEMEHCKKNVKIYLKTKFAEFAYFIRENIRCSERQRMFTESFAHSLELGLRNEDADLRVPFLGMADELLKILEFPSLNGAGDHAEVSVSAVTRAVHAAIDEGGKKLDILDGKIIRSRALLKNYENKLNFRDEEYKYRLREAVTRAEGELNALQFLPANPDGQLPSPLHHAARARYLWSMIEPFILEKTGELKAESGRRFEDSAHDYCVTEVCRRLRLNVSEVEVHWHLKWRDHKGNEVGEVDVGLASGGKILALLEFKAGMFEIHTGYLKQKKWLSCDQTKLISNKTIPRIEFKVANREKAKIFLCTTIPPEEHRFAHGCESLLLRSVTAILTKHKLWDSNCYPKESFLDFVVEKNLREQVIEWILSKGRKDSLKLSPLHFATRSKHLVIVVPS